MSGVHDFSSALNERSIFNDRVENLFASHPVELNHLMLTNSHVQSALVHSQKNAPSAPNICIPVV